MSLATQPVNCYQNLRKKRQNYKYDQTHQPTSLPLKKAQTNKQKKHYTAQNKLREQLIITCIQSQLNLKVKTGVLQRHQQDNFPSVVKTRLFWICGRVWWCCSKCKRGCHWKNCQFRSYHQALMPFWWSPVLTVWSELCSWAACWLSFCAYASRTPFLPPHIKQLGLMPFYGPV